MRLHSGRSIGRIWDPAPQHVFDPLLGAFGWGVLCKFLALHQQWRQALRTMSVRPFRGQPCSGTQLSSAAAIMSGWTLAVQNF